MAKKNHMYFDSKEIVCTYQGGETKYKSKYKSIKLRYNNIQSVSIKPCRERKGLKVVDSERIVIRSPLLQRQIEYYKFRENPFFEDYKAGLRLFCKSNRVTIYDEAQ